MANQNVNVAHNKVSDLKKLHADLGAYTCKCLTIACREISSYAKSHHRYKDRTRRLTNAIRFKVIGNERNRRQMLGQVYVDTNEVPYADYIEEGTEPHIIRARRVKRLRFFWERIGKVVYMKQVSHPGNSAYNYLRDARRSVSISAIFEREKANLIRELTK